MNETTYTQTKHRSSGSALICFVSWLLYSEAHKSVVGWHKDLSIIGLIIIPPCMAVVTVWRVIVTAWIVFKTIIKTALTIAITPITWGIMACMKSPDNGYLDMPKIVWGELAEFWEEIAKGSAR